MGRAIEINNINSYRFSYDKEPSDEQLGLLMSEVSVEVKRKFQAANTRFQEDLRQLCIVKRPKGNE